VGFLLAMTLPALVLALFVLGMVELARARRTPGAKHGTAMSSTGFDILQEALYPSKKHEIEQRDHESLMAEEDAQGAPPRSRIDLDKGTAHIHLP
jgi:Family of unknown function (DUF6191)